MRDFKSARIFSFAVLFTLSAGIISIKTPAEAVSAQAPSKQDPSKQDRVNLREPADYLIGPEDVLDILVWKNAELSRVVTVRPDGKISMPLIGDIQAAGLTPNQLRDSIVGRLKEYQESVVASVIVQGVNSYRIYIVGEVRNPGTYLLKTKTTILQAISLAGGFTQFASKNKMVLVRKKDDAGAAEEKISIRFDDLVSADEKTEKNLTLKPGDTIFVP